MLQREVHKHIRPSTWRYWRRLVWLLHLTHEPIEQLGEEIMPTYAHQAAQVLNVRAGRPLSADTTTERVEEVVALAKTATREAAGPDDEPKPATAQLRQLVLQCRIGAVHAWFQIEQPDGLTTLWLRRYRAEEPPEDLEVEEEGEDIYGIPLAYPPQWVMDFLGKKLGISPD